MDFGTVFNANQGVVRISTEFIVEYLTRCHSDSFQKITGHEDDHEVTDTDVCSRVKGWVLAHGSGAGRFGGLDDVGHDASVLDDQITIAR